MEGPVGPFSWPVRPARHFEEAVVERQVVPQRILPALSILPIIREALHDVAVYVGERKHPLG